MKQGEWTTVEEPEDKQLRAFLAAIARVCSEHGLCFQPEDYPHGWMHVVEETTDLMYALKFTPRGKTQC